MRRDGWVVSILALTVCLAGAGCGRGGAKEEPALTVAAAANLTGVMGRLAEAYRERAKVRVVVSYGSTAQLARQIENGAPYDVYAAADTEHVDELIGAGKLVAESRVVYARGQLALWSPNREMRTMEDLADGGVRIVAMAQPGFAPYGRAAVEALRAKGLWEKLKPKIVYANNINMARQYAASGNADAAFTALSLVMGAPGTVLKVDPKLYGALEQAAAVSTGSAEKERAGEFVRFLVSREGRKILQESGYR